MNLTTKEIDQILFYSKNGIIVRRSVWSDVEYLKTRLRLSDQIEIMASHSHSSFQALSLAFQESIFCLTIVDNDIPVGMFGINAKSLLSDQAVVWMLASRRLNRIKIRFLKNCKFFINIMLQYYPVLYNHVHVENLKALVWLKFLGASIHESKPHGPYGEKFCYFEFRR